MIRKICNKIIRTVIEINIPTFLTMVAVGSLIFIKIKASELFWISLLPYVIVLALMWLTYWQSENPHPRYCDNPPPDDDMV